MKRIVILGGHSDGVVLASAIHDLKLSGEQVEVYGFLNDNEAKGTEISGFSVLGRLEDFRDLLREKELYFVTALLKAKESFERSRRIEELEIPVERFLTIIHPTATVGINVRVGYGTFLGPHVTIMPGAVIGNHCSVRASANIGHDALVEDYCYIGPNVTVSGRAIVRRGAHLGPNSSVLDRMEVGSFSVVGIGSAVMKRVPNFTIVLGCPARIVRKLPRPSDSP